MTCWATEHNLLLDTTLTLRDGGLSAFHQKHVRQDALGTFLRAVEEGRIPTDSVLIVEALGRLRRAEPILAQAPTRAGHERGNHSGRLTVPDAGGPATSGIAANGQKK